MGIYPLHSMIKEYQLTDKKSIGSESIVGSVMTRILIALIRVPVECGEIRRESPRQGFSLFRILPPVVDHLGKDPLFMMCRAQ
jgi:hypothetical protein